MAAMRAKTAGGEEAVGPAQQRCAPERPTKPAGRFRRIPHFWYGGGRGGFRRCGRRSPLAMHPGIATRQAPTQRRKSPPSRPSRLFQQPVNGPMMARRQPSSAERRRAWQTVAAGACLRHPAAAASTTARPLASVHRQVHQSGWKLMKKLELHSRFCVHKGKSAALNFGWRFNH